LEVARALEQIVGHRRDLVGDDCPDAVRFADALRFDRHIARLRNGLELVERAESAAESA